MIRFLFLGLIRDRHRSMFPIIVVALGVMLTVVLHAWLTGVFGDSIEFTARFSTGHVKIMTSAYAENINQLPNDLALLNATKLLDTIKNEYPEISWNERIYFAGLADVPDKSGETRAQSNVAGIGIDMLSGNNIEVDRMNIRKSVRQGRLPEKKGEVLLSESLSHKLKVKPNDTISLISSTMYGEYSVFNFIISGTVEFGTTSLDRGTVIADISDVRAALNMEDATGEIVGYFNSGYYNDELAKKTVSKFNGKYNIAGDEFSPVMKSLREQNNMGVLVDYASGLFAAMIAIFLVAMSIVLWNAGLLGGLRRYGEFGMRLAIGEEKGHVFRTLIYESILIGIIGTIAGTIAGLTLAWYLERYGINFGAMMKNSTIMMPTVFKARITEQTWFIGFFPGIFSTLIGTMLSGIGIYKRKTAQLFKELEA
jgi:putative ABC transport system permease protein